MTRRFRLRPATPDDEPFLWHMLYYAAHMDEDGAASADQARANPFLAQFVEDWGRDGDIGVIAVDTATGRPLGAAWARVVAPHGPTGGGHDEALPEVAAAVWPECIGQGIGTAMLRALLDAARGRYPALALSVRETNPARRLYERLGFRVVSTITNRVGGTSYWMRVDLPMTYGCQSMVAPLTRLLLKHPRDAWQSQARVDVEWQTLNYTARPDFARAVAEYDALVALLAVCGIECHYLPRDDATTLDSIYTHDPLIVSRDGAILGRMGKDARRGEPDTARPALAALGVPVVGGIEGDGRLEGGDVLWLDARTLAVGQGYRTNAAGARQLTRLLGDAVDEVVPVPLPHWTGPADCLHLMSFISLVDHDLAVVYSRLMPVPFRQLLLERGYRLIEVPDEEYDSFACNVLAVAPRRCVMLSGNPVTQARLEAAGAEVVTFEGREICLKGGGGPTCLTRPLHRQV